MRGGASRPIFFFPAHARKRSSLAPVGDISGTADREILAMKRIVLVIGGGIAAYKCLDLIRRLRERRPVGA